MFSPDVNIAFTVFFHEITQARKLFHTDKSKKMLINIKMKFWKKMPDGRFTKVLGPPIIVAKFSNDYTKLVFAYDPIIHLFDTKKGKRIRSLQDPNLSAGKAYSGNQGDRGAIRLRV